MNCRGGRSADPPTLRKGIPDGPHSGPIPLKVAACVRKHLPRKDLSHQWRDILAFFASGTARMPRVNNRYNDTTHSPAITCATFIRCASYGASHEGWDTVAYQAETLKVEFPKGSRELRVQVI